MKTLRYIIPALALIGAALFYFYRANDTLKNNSVAEIAEAHIWAKGQSLDERAHPTLLTEHIERKDDFSVFSGAPNKVKPPVKEFNDLPDSEQKSLWAAFSEARREVRPIPESRSQREENLGYNFYALHPTQNMTTRFGSQGVQIVSSDRTYTEEDAGHPSTAWQAQMHLLSFAGKSIQLGAQAIKSEQASSRVEYHHHPELTEWFDNGVDGMEHGYTIATRPANLRDGEDVTLAVALEGLQVAVQERDDDSQALVFMDEGRTVMSYSKLVVVDAQGKELPATMKPTPTGFVLAYNDSQAAYPVTVDPLLINEEAKLNRIDAAGGDLFGHSVAISGDSVIIGASADDDAGSDSGSAYVFTGSGSSWHLQVKLNASDAAAADRFGSSVAISGDSVVVGAHWDDDAGINSGSAYVFSRSGSTWSEQAKLNASDAVAQDFFGCSVAISGDFVIVGAYQDDDGGSSAGSAYIFSRIGSTWSQQDKLNASDASTADRFGYSVAISDDSVVVGAFNDDDAGTDSGSAYVFTRSGNSWSQQDKLIASDAATQDEFGVSVAISGDSVIVGASGDDNGGTDSGSAYVFIRSGSNWSQQARLQASDAANQDNFGTSVAISGDYVVVGASLDNVTHSSSPTPYTNSGSAYVFTRTGTSWSEQAQLIASDLADGDNFGNSVAISGDSVVVGAFHDDGSAGSTYVFTRKFSIWSQKTKLIASDAASNDNFGNSVAISGDSAVSGAFQDDDAGSGSGSAYVFIRSGSTWSQQAKLIASDAANFDLFGKSVAISGDSVIVGAYGNDDAGATSGSAYVFTRSGSTWSEQDKLTASDAAAGDSFGFSVAVSGDSVVVGAYSNGDAGSNSGSAYIFSRSGSAWSEQAKLNASDAAAADSFGKAVAISGDSVVVGANNDDDFGSNSGSAYVFTRSGSTWSQQSKLNASDAAEFDFFGSSVAISGDSVVVGAHKDDDGASASGSAYVFTRSGSTWSQQAKLNATQKAANDQFGYSVAISGDSVVVGAILKSQASSPTSGSAYIFTRSGSSWSLQNKVDASDAGTNDEFGNSVAISGDSVIVGGHRDDDGGTDSGSVYIYRFSVPSVRELLVYNQLGEELLDGAASTSFTGVQLGTVINSTFRLANAGALNLDIQSVSLSGADSGQFSLTLPDISSATDLDSGQSLDFTINFNPSGSSGLRNATVTVTSNDTNTPTFTFTIAGLGLSNSTDGDGDGMNDWAEYSLRGFGFDWTKSQPSKVDDLLGNASNAGLYSLDDAAAVTGTGVLVDVDMATNTAAFIISLEESLDLQTFTPITIDPAKLTVDGNGNIRYEVAAPAGKKFFHAGFKP